MNKKHILLVLLGLASSTVLAQSQAQGRTPADQSATQPPAQMNRQSNSSTQQTYPESQMQSGAQSSGASEVQTVDIPPAPESVKAMAPKTENGVTYLCGGIGTTEAAKIKSEAHDYDMMLTFATKGGNYLADVNVNVADARGNPILKTSCNAPIMLIDFPKSGTYHVRAETGGYTLNKTARVTTKGRSHAALVMLWPQQLAEAPAEPAATSSGDNGRNNGASGASDGNDDAR